MFNTLLSNFNLLSKVIQIFVTLSSISPSIVIGETAGCCFLRSISNSFVFVTLRSKKLSLNSVVNLSTVEIKLMSLM